jgi:hypothetical protein
MPNGRLSPVAKVETRSARAPFALRPRNTAHAPGSLSATKMSPFWRRAQQARVVEAGGVLRHGVPGDRFRPRPAGRGTTVGGLFAARVARGAEIRDGDAVHRSRHLAPEIRERGRLGPRRSAPGTASLAGARVRHREAAVTLRWSGLM